MDVSGDSYDAASNNADRMKVPSVKRLRGGVAQLRAASDVLQPPALALPEPEAAHSSCWEELPHHNDLCTVLVQFLEARDIDALRRVNRPWRDAGPRLAMYLHTVSCPDIDFLFSSGLEQQPSSMRRLDRLDLRRYGAAPSPIRSPARDGCEAAAAPITPTRAVVRSSWIAAFLDSRASCKKLRALLVGPLLPLISTESLLGLCESLEELSLRECHRLKNETLSKLASRSVQRVDLFGCRYISHGGFSSLLACPRINKALLGRVLLTDDTLACIPSDWPELSTLELTVASARGASALGLLDLLQRCRRLRALRLFECSFEEHDWRLLLTFLATPREEGRGQLQLVQIVEPHGMSSRTVAHFLAQHPLLRHAAAAADDGDIDGSARVDRDAQLLPFTPPRTTRAQRQAAAAVSDDCMMMDEEDCGDDYRSQPAVLLPPPRVNIANTIAISQELLSSMEAVNVLVAAAWAARDLAQKK